MAKAACLIGFFPTTTTQLILLLSLLLCQVYWNVPSGVCWNSPDKLDPAKFGIRTNNKQLFHGSQIVTFYEDQLDTDGKYSVKECVHGGLPQNADIHKHLEKVKKDIEKAIPDKKFSGPAVIDWEHWRPAYALNWGARTIYKRSSKDGEDLFNKAARKFVRETLLLAKKLREQEEWECAFKFEAYNLQLLWMYQHVNAFYPPIYLFELNERSEKEKRYVYARIVMTRWLQKKLAKLNTPIYLFSKIEYSPYELDAPFYNNHSLCNSLDYPADNAVKGVILWSSSANMTQRCGRISEYVDGVLGPKVQRIQARVAKCASKVCSNHGRCQLTQPKRDFGCGDEHYTEHYSCKCDTGYGGEYCQHGNNKKKHRAQVRIRVQRRYIREGITAYEND
uniref:Hyaluronidase n=1 Tax=Ditylenchus dipsaci TaxID=166011 RepID=A0A915CPD8_9BILA